MPDPEFLKLMDFEGRGIPIARATEVNLRNNHAQYIFTWYVVLYFSWHWGIIYRLSLTPPRYSLSLATSIMLWMVMKRPSSDVTRRVRMNKHW